MTIFTYNQRETPDAILEGVGEPYRSLGKGCSGR
jgi:hypothetical protein